ncbi:GspH/FimT family pseudopilin [Halomonas getboli]|uniref:GspH/FimT family pseudopilin n=1 Tax=Halomonas getboli TaxID=2935862 RepID=UPI001FFEA852|nr:GspH/FimT family pseudopilin [Halomonas getboli]MCK2185420.1 GspH/FimT family pseudopilin [Halomonas getboli]
MQPGATEGQYLTEKSCGLAKAHHAGFTLIELLVALAVLVIMATVAVPGFQRMMARNEVAAEVMRIRTALAVARNTAVTRRTTISVCPRPTPSSTSCDLTDWSHPIVVVLGQAPSGDLTDTRLLKVLAGSAGPDVSFNRAYPVRFQANGWSRGHNGTFTICARNGNSASVVISNMGKTRTTHHADEC